MSIPAHTVLARCVVVETGETLEAGDSFTPANAAQRDRLIEAGCLRAPGTRTPAKRAGPDVPPATGTDTPKED